MHKAGGFRNVAAGCLVLVLATLLSGPVLAAEFDCAPPEASVEAPSGKDDVPEELVEVIVDGRKPSFNTKDLRAWLMRMVGQYVYEGQVEYCGTGNAVDRSSVTGRADCVGFSAAPSVQCEVDVRWPVAGSGNRAQLIDSASSMSPGMMVLGLESNHRGIQLMQVDARGIAEWTTGLLFGDTLILQTACHSSQGTCRKVTQIGAKPGSNQVSMVVDIEIDNQPAIHQDLLLRRVSNAQESAQSGASR